MELLPGPGTPDADASLSPRRVLLSLDTTPCHGEGTVAVYKILKQHPVTAETRQSQSVHFSCLVAVLSRPLCHGQSCLQHPETNLSLGSQHFHLQAKPKKKKKDVFFKGHIHSK